MTLLLIIDSKVLSLVATVVSQEKYVKKLSCSKLGVIQLKWGSPQTFEGQGFLKL